jgi:type I restriction enzyme S subunit
MSGLIGGVSISKLRDFEIILPPLPEQQQIVSFLDTKTALIDSLIEKTQRKIELLKEKRTALINEVVIGKIVWDGDAWTEPAEVKDSGVEWIGEIPSHWTMVKPFGLFTPVKRPIKDTDEIITCFRDGQVTLRKNRRTDGFTVSLKEIGYQRILVGDLVIHQMDGFEGSIGVSDSEGKSSPVLTVIPKSNNYNNFYWMYLLRRMSKTGFIESLSKSIRERTTEFRWNMWKGLPFCNPPLKEQNEIVEYLDEQTQLIDNTVSIEEKRIKFLIEYRQSLISEVVTGKQKVVNDE